MQLCSYHAYSKNGLLCCGLHLAQKRRPLPIYSKVVIITVTLRVFFLSLSMKSNFKMFYCGFCISRTRSAGGSFVSSPSSLLCWWHRIEWPRKSMCCQLMCLIMTSYTIIENSFKNVVSRKAVVTQYLVRRGPFFFTKDFFSLIV